MGRELTCLNRTAERRRAPEDTARALGMRTSEPVGVLWLEWAQDGTPAAMSTTYLASELPEPRALAGWVTDAAGTGAMPGLPPAADRHLPRSPGCRPPRLARTAPR